MPSHKDPGFDGYERLPGRMVEVNTPAGVEARGETVNLYCRGAHCSHHRTADMADYIARGWGDVPLSEFRKRWKCPDCGLGNMQTVRGTKPKIGLDGLPRVGWRAQ